MRILLLNVLFLFNSFDAVSKVIIVPPSENAQEQLQEAMILVESGDEIQLADAINIHAQQGLVETIRLKGRRFDCGSVEGFMKASFYEYEKRFQI